jgi:hypothetical protein
MLFPMLTRESNTIQGRRVHAILDLLANTEFRIGRSDLGSFHLRDLSVLAVGLPSVYTLEDNDDKYDLLAVSPSLIKIKIKVINRPGLDPGPGTPPDTLGEPRRRSLFPHPHHHDPDLGIRFAHPDRVTGVDGESGLVLERRGVRPQLKFRFEFEGQL